MVAVVSLPVAEEQADVCGALSFVVLLVPLHQEMDVSGVVASRTPRSLLLPIIFAVFYVLVVVLLE